MLKYIDTGGIHRIGAYDITVSFFCRRQRTVNQTLNGLMVAECRREAATCIATFSGILRLAVSPDQGGKLLLHHQSRSSYLVSLFLTSISSSVVVLARASHQQQQQRCFSVGQMIIVNHLGVAPASFQSPFIFFVWFEERIGENDGKILPLEEKNWRLKGCFPVAANVFIFILAGASLHFQGKRSSVAGTTAQRFIHHMLTRIERRRRYIMVVRRIERERESDAQPSHTRATLILYWLLLIPLPDGNVS